MKKILLKSIGVLAVATFIVGCGQSVSVPSVFDSPDKCDSINKDLILLDEFTKKVENMSAFHLEEAAAAWEDTKVTTSTNKTRMLKDAEKRKLDLEAEHQKYGCEAIE